MNQCPKCKAIINPKWAQCLACGCAVASGSNEPQDPESHHTRNEPAAIQAEGSPSFPVAIKMECAILGAAVDVQLWADRAMVDGCEYSNQEMVDLKSRGLPAADLRKVHKVKKEFDGVVIPSEEVESFQTISRW